MDNSEILSVWKEIESYLEAQKRQIADEILHYPPPIPACDAQFNYLLEERARISQEINRLETLAQESLIHPNPVEFVEQFMAASSDIEDETKQKIRSRLPKI